MRGIVMKRNAQIDELTKKSIEYETLVKNLQDQVKELQSNKGSFPKPDLEEGSAGQYQNVLGPD